jgi:hypothetical protein
MIPAVRLVPPGHTLVTPGKRLFGGLAHYHDRAPRGAPCFPRISFWTIPDLSTPKGPRQNNFTFYDGAME